LQNSLAPLRSFVAQVFWNNAKDKDIIDRFAFLMNEQSSGQLVATRAELLDLLKLCSDHSGDVIFVLDAVDECDDPENLIKDLLLLSSDPNIKILFFSRPNVSALFTAVPEEQRLNIGGKNSRDIEIFVTAKLEDLTDDELLPSSADIPQLSSHLILGANGMFIWIRLMVNFLNSPALTRRQRIDAIMNITVPEGLDSMYDRIIQLIDQSNTTEKRLACRIISWILFSNRPLTTRELQVAISQGCSISPDDEDEFSDFKRAVIMSCAGLVEVQKTSSPTFISEIDSFQLIHLSAREYIYSHHPDYVSSSPRNASPLGSLLNSCSGFSVEMTTTCLQVLSYTLPAHALSGKQAHDLPSHDMTPSQVHEVYPFVGYATCYWFDHLADTLDPKCLKSEKLPKMINILATFLTLKRNIMAYIETRYVFQASPPIGKLKYWTQGIMSPVVWSQVEHSLLKKVIDDILELLRFLDALDSEWGDRLLQSPSSVWGETTAFTKSRLVDEASHTQVRTLIMDAPRTEGISSRYLSKISELSEDGKTVAILSIWPSKYVTLPNLVSPQLEVALLTCPQGF
jgi:hypothetical protein